MLENSSTERDASGNPILGDIGQYDADLHVNAVNKQLDIYSCSEARTHVDSSGMPSGDTFRIGNSQSTSSTLTLRT